MRSFFEWFRDEQVDPGEPWLMLGKGPSFKDRHAYDLSHFHLLSLNHAVRDQPVRVGHVIDYDVVDACAGAIQRNAELLVMPWRPHVEFAPGARNLEELAQVNPTLRRLNEQGRLLWYNLSSSREQHENSPIVEAEFFSAEAGLNLLALSGIRKVRSLGVDGGADYSAEFDDLKDQTLLACGHKSFDAQFRGFARTISTTGVDYAPLNLESPIRIYVGATEAQMLPVKVLEHSIRKHASMTVAVLPLHLAGIDIRLPRDPQNHPRTPFSFQRFLIPALNKHQGHAIYLDSDMLVFEDISRLWRLGFDDADLLTVKDQPATDGKAQFSVLLLNCAGLGWDIENIVDRLDDRSLTYEQLMFDMSLTDRVRACIDPAWNSLEHFTRRRTALLHYTRVDTQPWLSRSNRWNRLWTETLFEAMDAGEISLAEIEEEAALGHVRPSLAYQAKWRIPDSRKLNRKARKLDDFFVPPHAARPPARQSVTNWMRSVFRFDHSS